MKTHRLPMLLSLVLILSGCASNRLALRLDIYNGPLQDFNSPEKIKSLINDMEGKIEHVRTISANQTDAIEQVKEFSKSEDGESAVIRLAKLVRDFQEKRRLAGFEEAALAYKWSLKRYQLRPTNENLRDVFEAELKYDSAEKYLRGFRASLVKELNETKNGSHKLGSVERLVNSLNTGPLSGGYGQSTEKANHDLDRFHEAADPVWRILSGKQNELFWNRAFTTNYFYAEGNSGVVVVRDSPIHYRIQRANNNPTALVQSQLRISRAVADAAIEIAAAASGMPVSLPTPGGQAAAMTTAQKRSDLEEQLRISTNSIDLIVSQLKSLKDSPDPATIQNGLTNLLNGAAGRFK